MDTVAKTLGDIWIILYKYRDIVFFVLDLVKPVIVKVKEQSVEGFVKEHLADIKERSDIKTSAELRLFIKESKEDTNIIQRACHWFCISETHYFCLMSKKF
jgi:hypothetical protein